MPINYDNALGSLANGGPGAVRYDGDALINDEKHQFCIDLAAQLEHDTELIQFPSNVGSGATIIEAEERINKLRGRMLKMADGLRTIGDAAKSAAPPIRVGTAADPEVQAALKESSAAYRSVEEIVPPQVGQKDGGGRRSGAHDEERRSQPAERPGVDGPSPRTRTSADAPAPAAVAPAGQGQMTGAPMQPAAMAPQAPGAGLAAPGMGGPSMAPAAFTPGGGSLAGTSPQPPRRRDDRNDATTLAGGGVVAAPVGAAAGNPSVTGGRVDPAQISGRTASTSPSAGAAPLKMGPSAPTGMMGGMGGMPLGGGMGGNGAGARTAMPQPKRDRDSERILTGEEARDKAFVSHILRDDDPIASEYVDDRAKLADLLPDERHTPTTSSADAESPVLPDIPTAEPVLMSVPPPPPPRPIGFAPTQYPGEPRDDEKW